MDVSRASQPSAKLHISYRMTTIYIRIIAILRKVRSEEQSSAVVRIRLLFGYVLVVDCFYLLYSFFKVLEITVYFQKEQFPALISVAADPN